MSDAVGLVNPIGNAAKNSFAGVLASGAGEDFVPMLSTHIGRNNGVDLHETLKSATDPDKKS
jgi:hypothetical protein